MVRASGEPPGRGAPLMLSQGGIYSCAVVDRASLNDFTSTEFDDMKQAGLTEEEMVRMIGNCAPRRLVSKPLGAITRIMMDYCPRLGLSHGAAESDTDTGEGAAEAAQGEDEVAEVQQVLVVIPVLPKVHKVALRADRVVRVLRSGKLRTGKLLEAARRSLKGELKVELLVPAGSWSRDGVETFVVAHIALTAPDGLTAFSVKDLAGTDAYHLASLALAKVESHAGGHTTVEKILPMLDSTGEYRVGALAAKRLDPPTVCNGVCTWTRAQALAHCRAAEARVEAGLAAAAAEAEQHDRALSDYLTEWRQQVTVMH